MASALYGGSALAGVLNLVSRAPDGKSQWLLSQGSLGSSDADVFISRPGTSGGFTFAGSGHYRPRRDEDHDGWAELPGYERFTARPRWFIDEGSEPCSPRWKSAASGVKAAPWAITQWHRASGSR